MVLLNKKQVEKIKEIAGGDIFKKIGLPESDDRAIVGADHLIFKSNECGYTEPKPPRSRTVEIKVVVDAAAIEANKDVFVKIIEDAVCNGRLKLNRR